MKMKKQPPPLLLNDIEVGINVNLEILTDDVSPILILNFFFNEFFVLLHVSE